MSRRAKHKPDEYKDLMMPTDDMDDYHGGVCHEMEGCGRCTRE